MTGSFHLTEIDDQGRNRLVYLTKPEKTLLTALKEMSGSWQLQFIVATDHAYPIRSYAIIDIADPHLKLGVEIDGVWALVTPESQARLKKRDERLEALGWTIIRFTDEEVEADLAHVCKAIAEHQAMLVRSWWEQTCNRIDLGRLLCDVFNNCDFPTEIRLHPKGQQEQLKIT